MVFELSLKDYHQIIDYKRKDEEVDRWKAGQIDTWIDRHWMKDGINTQILFFMYY